MKESTSFQLRIGDIIHAVIKNRYLIIILTVAGLAVGIVMSVLSYMRGEMSKQYVVKTSMVFSVQMENGRYPASDTPYPKNDDITMTDKLIDSALYVLKSDRLYEALLNDVDMLGVTTKDIGDNLTVKRSGSTMILEASLYWRSAEEGVRILDAFLNVANDTLMETLGAGRVTVVNRPMSKYLVTGTINASLWLYMAILGGMAGLGFSVLKMLVQPTVLNVKDIDKFFGLETMAEIPGDKKHFKRKRSLLKENGGRDDAVMSEYESMAQILRNRLGAGAHKCVYITSSAAGEGKTTAVARLGVKLSELGHKVLLVDLDLKDPTLGSAFMTNVAYEHSFNALYRGDINEVEAITSLNGKLDILPSVPERKRIPSDDTMMEYIRKLKARYDYILIDTAAIGVSTDTARLNEVADGVLYVIRQDHTPSAVIGDALEKLDKSGAHMLGCVYNDVRGIC